MVANMRNLGQCLEVQLLTFEFRKESVARKIKRLKRTHGLAFILQKPVRMKLLEPIARTGQQTKGDSSASKRVRGDFALLAGGRGSNSRRRRRRRQRSRLGRPAWCRFEQDDAHRVLRNLGVKVTSLDDGRK
jgi:hypothetical protein